MAFFEKNQAVGLDLGQGAVKAVSVSLKGHTIEVDKAAVFDCRAEGVLDDHELCTNLVPWLENCAITPSRTVVNIPQYLASTQTTAFPPGSEKNLDEMVGYETRNLAGLSEEAFTFDYAQLPGASDGGNQVVIGICRESVIDERAEMIKDAQIPLADLAIGGIALANAYFHLCPESANSELPELVLDVGCENTTLAVIAGRRLLFASSLMFGTERYIVGLAKLLKCEREEAGKQMHETGISAADRTSPYALAARPLDNELASALENWRAQEEQQLKRLAIAKVSVCGGGAHIRGLDKYLGAAFDCPSQTIGVSVPGGGQADPQLVGALGLALQGCDVASVQVSLAPTEIRWWAQRTRRFGFLAATIAIIAVLTGIAEVRSYVQLTGRQRELKARLDNVDNCMRIVPELESVLQDIDFHQRLLVPFIEKGNHGQRILAATAALGEAREAMLANMQGKVRGAPVGWALYLADANSFGSGRSVNGDDPGTGSTTAIAPPVVPVLPTTQPGLAGDTTPIALQKIHPDEVETWQGLVAAVYTSAEPSEPYKLVREFVSQLNQTDLFEDVDLMPETESAGREDIFMPWLSLPKRTLPGNLRRFVLRLPFETADINLSALESPDEN